MLHIGKLAVVILACGICFSELILVIYFGSACFSFSIQSVRQTGGSNFGTSYDWFAKLNTALTF